MSELFQGLNPQQLIAVRDTVQKSALVLAGAGSGKTSVLTKRIAYLRECGVSPLNMLAVTFTNKASGEMRERIAKLIGEEEAKKLTMGTFHKVCILMLKKYGNEIGIPSNFTIADPSDQKQILRDVMKNYGMDTTANYVSTMLGKISDLKNEGATPSDFFQRLSSHPKKPGDDIIYKVYKGYQERLKRLNTLDFDDLLLEAVRLLDHSYDVRKYYQTRYHYVMADEYQDTNPIQYRLLKLLSAKEKSTIGKANNIFVVGDADQSIYGFRGSDLNIILNFEQDFPEAQVIKLEQNYRSTKAVVRAGNAIIENNINRKDKTAYTDNAIGDAIKIHRAYDSEQEAEFIANEIQNLVAYKGFKHKDIAILYRTNFISRGLEAALIKKRVPYKLINGVGFYERAEVKDTIAYLKVVVNPKDDIAMKRVLSTYPGVGSTTIKRIEETADNLGMGLTESFREFKSSRKTTQEALDSLRETLKEMFLIYRVAQSEVRSDIVSKMMEIVWKRTAYKETLMAKKNKENFSRLENLDELERVAKDYEKTTPHPTLPDFLDGVALQTDADRKQDDNSVSLLTVHASKGLEYPVVFVAGLEEGIFPHKNAVAPEDIEEERRLMYVAVTRAEKELYLTYAKTRKSYMGTDWGSPSRFLDEIPNELVQQVW